MCCTVNTALLAQFVLLSNNTPAEQLEDVTSRGVHEFLQSSGDFTPSTALALLAKGKSRKCVSFCRGCGVFSFIL